VSETTHLVYELTPGQKHRFVWSVVCMWGIPLRTRLELIWTAATGRDNKAKARLYWSEARCARFVAGVRELVRRAREVA